MTRFMTYAGVSGSAGSVGKLQRVGNGRQIDIVLADETGIIDDGAPQHIRKKINDRIQGNALANEPPRAQFFRATFLRLGLVGG